MSSPCERKEEETCKRKLDFEEKQLVIMEEAVVQEEQPQEAMVKEKEEAIVKEKEAQEAIVKEKEAQEAIVREENEAQEAIVKEKEEHHQDGIVNNNVKEDGKEAQPILPILERTESAPLFPETEEREAKRSKTTPHVKAKEEEHAE